MKPENQDVKAKPERATQSNKPISTEPAPMKQAPVAASEPPKMSEDALDEAWALHRFNLGCAGCPSPIERPKGWKP